MLRYHITWSLSHPDNATKMNWEEKDEQLPTRRGPSRPELKLEAAWEMFETAYEMCSDLWETSKTSSWKAETELETNCQAEAKNRSWSFVVLSFDPRLLLLHSGRLHARRWEFMISIIFHNAHVNFVLM